MNVFKHFDVQTWKKASKEGEVTSVMVNRQFIGLVYHNINDDVISNFRDIMSNDIHCILKWT